MTEAAIFPPSSQSKTTPSIYYQVGMPQPESHLFEVTLKITGWQSPILDLKMPVWTPGSYLVREYSKHLQEFFSVTVDGKRLADRKISKNHWQVETSGVSELAVGYRIFANELTVRTNHLDSTHGYFNGAALFFLIPGFEKHPIRVKIVTPRSDWRVTTVLPPVSGEENTFEAVDFDTLVDSPFEIGCHQLYEFEVLSKPHQLAIWGEGNAQPEKLIEDIKKIIQVEAKLFDGLPYDRYIFLLHLATQGAGGLEHKQSCTLNYQRFGFGVKDKYDRFMQLVAHEFFHLWNVKRIRPKALEVFDYQEENYTPSLWFSEGTTSYFDLLIPFWAGIYDANSFLNNISQEISRYQTTPGRKVQPVSESSFDAWIKLYRPDANSGNSQISYYLKGEMISFLLDLLIRSRHKNKRSLNDVMQKMWQQFGKSEIGFTPTELKAAIESVADMDLEEFFDKYIDGTDELPFNEFLAPFGLELISVYDDLYPYLGLTTEKGSEIIKFVEVSSPAQLAGIDAGDELLAINGFRVKADRLVERLKDFQPGDTIEITFFHQDRLRTSLVTLAEPRPNCYHIEFLENRSFEQQENFVGWLGNF